MKTLYVLDNGQGYSANHVHFVAADPDVDGADIGERLLAAVRKWEWEPGQAKLLLTATEFALRDESYCCTPDQFFAEVVQ